MPDARSCPSYGGRTPHFALLAAGLATAAVLLGGCPPAPDGDPNADTGGGSPVFNNTNDPTNDGARYIGSSACGACHPDFAAVVELHGHTHALKPVQGQPPSYPSAAERAGVPDPPAGFSWQDISYVISGYLHCAFFLDGNGYILTTGVTGVDTKWLLPMPSIARLAQFIPYLPQQTAPLPYEYETCFRCHTTGAQPLDPDNPRFQDGRPGIRGTWAEPGVRCEACHGPGSNHAPDPQARNLFVDSSAQTCARCHTDNHDPNLIPVEHGLLGANTQYPQLLASGGHSAFSCMVCHDPHASITYDRDRAWRNRCTACHGGQNLAFHEGKTFRQGDYEEPVSCVSCHMPPAGISGARAPAGVVGSARVGDVAAHIFRIDTTHPDASAIISADGTQLLKDAQGRAALTVDYVCLRCHNEASETFPLLPDGAVQIADGMHTRAANGGAANATGTAQPRQAE